MDVVGCHDGLERMAPKQRLNDNYLLKIPSDSLSVVQVTVSMIDSG